MDLGWSIESHQEGHNTRDASETTGQVYLLGVVSTQLSDYELSQNYHILGLAMSARACGGRVSSQSPSWRGNTS